MKSNKWFFNVGNEGALYDANGVSISTYGSGKYVTPKDGELSLISTNTTSIRCDNGLSSVIFYTKDSIAAFTGLDLYNVTRGKGVSPGWFKCETPGGTPQLKIEHGIIVDYKTK